MAGCGLAGIALAEAGIDASYALLALLAGGCVYWLRTHPPEDGAAD